MAPQPPASPDEGATRAYVQAQGQMGSQAQQAPSIATAGDAMQTAMARSAGMNAPSNFNATQVATIQNPFSRADSQLAANNAGAGGVLGAISGSTRDYLQQAEGGLNLQKEITKRAVQQMLEQHKFDAEKLANDREEIAWKREQQKHDREVWLAEQDPNSPAGKQKKLDAENALYAAQHQHDENALQHNPSSAQQIAGQTGRPIDAIETVRAMPQYASLGATANDLAQAGFTAPEYASMAYQSAVQMAVDGVIPQDSVGNLAHILYASFGPTFPGYDPSLAHDPAPTGGRGMNPVQAAITAGAVPRPSALPPTGTTAAMQAHLAEQQHIAEAEAAGLLTPQTVSMSETDKKKLKGKTKNPKK